MIVSINYLYWLAGFVLLITALMTFTDKTHPRRLSTGLFWLLYAIIFLVFDVEAVFLLPFAASFPRFNLGECVAMLVFFLLVIEGLAWAWQKRVLTWT